MEENNVIEIFISHSSKDANIAQAIVDLLKSAFVISANKIRCTSLDGYRLLIGVKTSETLRKELLSAPIFLAIITENSINSTYPMFEFGARWGGDKKIIPVICSTKGIKILPAPLQDTNASIGFKENSIHELLKTIASILNLKLEETSVYIDKVKNFVNIIKGEMPCDTDDDDNFNRKVDKYMEEHTMSSEEIDNICK